MYAQFPTRPTIVSEGDSWFQHPLVNDTIDYVSRFYHVYCLSAAGLQSFSDLTLICFYHCHSQMFGREMLDANRARMSPRTRALFAASLSFMRGSNHLTRSADQRSATVRTCSRFDSPT